MNELNLLRDEVAMLRNAIRLEADYCYKWEADSKNKGDFDRAKRHKERGDRLMSYLEIGHK